MIKLLLLLGLVVTPIIAIKKKHTYKIPIIILNVISIAIVVLTIVLANNREIGRDSEITLGIIAGLMWLSSFIWCFITPKNKE